jgi:hypothetical protein
MKLEQVRDWLRGGEANEGRLSVDDATLKSMADAIDAHLTTPPEIPVSAGEAVAWVHRASEDNIISARNKADIAKLEGIRGEAAKAWDKPLYATPPPPAGFRVVTDASARTAFNDGVLLALQVLNAAGNGGDAHYMELLKCVDHRELLQRASDEEMLDLTDIEKWIAYGIETRSLAAHDAGGV